jgi:polyisoprenoid-binding protein YceI
MQRFFGWLAVGGLLLAGQAVDNTAVSPSTASAEDAVSAGSAAAAVKSIPLTPKNTTIQFVGTHSPPRQPEPRKGSFEKFSGKAEVDLAGKTLKGVAVEIETGSLKTEFDKLTNHLNSPDFFDTREYPTAKFKSTQITAGENGQQTITGKLTLMKTTKEISFPATVQVSDAGLSLKADFQIDRMDFGIGVDQKGVERPVSLSIAISKPAKAE